ncbi:MAG TPA: hypothetical protein VK786_02435 [bacterium]|jgi:hypothetical protein|nr:hypothetical protein [bacterium]
MRIFVPLAAVLLLLSTWAFSYPGERVFQDGCGPDLLVRAEHRAQPAAARILAEARRMTVDERCILIGGCWDYIDAVWTRAGFPDGSRRVTVFHSRKRGPYAPSASIRPGDWLYFVNHSYGDIEHSAIFVAWADRDRHQAYMLSYAGQQRAECARYKLYDISDVFQVIRAKG